MRGVRRITPVEDKVADLFEPVVFLYDNLPGGVGFSEELFKAHDSLLSQAHAVIATCTCASGCPSCVGPINYVGRMSKEVANRLLQIILGKDEESP
jgi:DEAD/DEAH box helicase domain-containing protein